jgi:mono/diheme cytochrome c family protein
MNHINGMGERLMRTAIIPILTLFLVAANPGGSASRAEELSQNDWLLRAENDEARFRLLQKQLRGFDQPMWEVGERFEQLHDALRRENYELAVYHWDKIKTAIENGVAKRPARGASARGLFLGELWTDVRAGLESADNKKAWDAFEKARSACLACHQAEKVGFMNRQAVFDLARPPDR